MKKSLLVAFGSLALCSLLVVGCKGKSLNGEVKLLSLEGEKTILQAYHLGEELDFTKSSAFDYQYMVVDKNDTFVEMKISLDNPNDYHIFDFNLECNDENAKVKINGDYELLSSQKSINWKGDNNSAYIVSLEFTKSLEDIELNLTNLYFSDRETGQNKYTADLNNKGTFFVYRVTEDLDIVPTNIQNGLINFQIDNVDERIENLKVNDNAVVDNKFDIGILNFKLAYDVKLTDDLTYNVVKNINYDITPYFDLGCTYSYFDGYKFTIMDRITTNSTYHIIFTLGNEELANFETTDKDFNTSPNIDWQTFTFKVIVNGYKFEYTNGV